MGIWITVDLRHNLFGGSNPLMGQENTLPFSENRLIFIALSKHSEINLDWKWMQRFPPSRWQWEDLVCRGRCPSGWS